MGGKNSCMATHQDLGAVGSTKMGQGGDLDAAVLAAANFSSSSPSQKLSLSFACKDLPNMDTFSLSDPFLVLYKQQGNMWHKLGQTEVIHDNLNPQWVTKMNVEYHFEQSERFKLEVYDIDDDKQPTNLAAQDFCGALEFQLHEVVTCIDQRMTKPLVNPKLSNLKGQVSVTAEEITATSNSEIVIFNPQAQLSEASGLYFFIIYKCISPG